MDLKEKLEAALSADRLHLLRVVADVAGTLGFPVYMVGGSVRDLMLDRDISDFDLTVEGEAGELAESILKKLGGKILVHSQFGTARWTLTESTLHRLGVPLYQSDNFPAYLDFVSARSETYPRPGALPVINRSTIDADLRRRDFTINTMAIRLDGYHFGELLDPLDGQKDIEDKLIRILHKRSFIDDPTRMFRAIRYSMRYGFSLEAETRQAFYDSEARTVLTQLSGERIRHEFDLIFEEERPPLALSMLDDGTGLAKVVHPALENGGAAALSHMKNPPDDFGRFAFPEILSFRQTLGWILYLKHLTEPQINSVAERLAFPALLTKSICAASTLAQGLPSFRGWKPSQWTLYLDELPPIAVYAVWLTAPEEKSLREYLTKWQFVRPSITGNDLKARGVEPGPRYAVILRQLRDAWLDGEVKTEEEEKRLLKTLISRN